MQRYSIPVQTICIEKYFLKKCQKMGDFDEKSQEVYDLLAYGYY